MCFSSGRLFLARIIFYRSFCLTVTPFEKYLVSLQFHKQQKKYQKAFFFLLRQTFILPRYSSKVSRVFMYKQTATLIFHYDHLQIRRKSGIAFRIERKL